MPRIPNPPPIVMLLLVLVLSPAVPTRADAPLIQQVALWQMNVGAQAAEHVPPDTPVTDGNPLEVRVTLVNPTDDALALRLAVISPDDGDTPIAQRRVSLRAGASDTVRVPLASGGYAWLEDGTPRDEWRLQVTVQADDGALQDDTQTALQVLPRPLVLVNGYNDNQNFWLEHPERDGINNRANLVAALHDIHPEWRGYAVGDGQVAGSIYLGDINRPFTETDTLQSAAENLNAYVEGVREHANAWQVDMVGHSTGGLVIRRYIHEHMGDAPSSGTRVVNRVLHLAVPHGGAECADILHNVIGDIPYMYPIRYQLQTSYINDIFNPFDAYNQRGVPYVLVRGTEVNYALKTCLLEPDGIVSTASAWAQTPNNPVTGVRDEAAASHVHVADSDHFTRLVGDYLALGPAAYDALNAGAQAHIPADMQMVSRAAAPRVVGQASNPQVVFILGRLVALQPGETAAYDIPFPAADAAGVALFGTPVEATLTAPGMTAQPANTADWTAFGVAVLSAANPEPATWTLTLSNPSAEATTLQASAWVRGSAYDLGVTMDDGLRVAPRQNGEPLQAATVSLAVIRLGTTDVTHTTLTADGADVYSADLSPFAAGDYVGVVRVTTADRTLATNVSFRVRETVAAAR